MKDGSHLFQQEQSTAKLGVIWRRRNAMVRCDCKHALTSTEAGCWALKVTLPGDYRAAVDARLLC